MFLPCPLSHGVGYVIGTFAEIISSAFFILLVLGGFHNISSKTSKFQEAEERA